MTIKELSGLNGRIEKVRSQEALAAALLDSIKRKTALEGREILVDNYLNADTRIALQQACEERHCQLRSMDYAMFGKAGKACAFVVSYPNAEGNIEDYSDFIEDLHEQNLLVAMDCYLPALALLKSPGSLGADFAFGKEEENYFLVSKEISEEASKEISEEASKEISEEAPKEIPEEAPKEIDNQNNTEEGKNENLVSINREEAARVHGMTAYLNDALEVYGYEQENNAFFNTLKIRIPEEISLPDFQALAEDYELPYSLCNDEFILLSINEEDDSESLSDIIACLAEAADNFGTPVDEEDWSDICALDGSLLR
ncbi:MAG: hypothetical protein IJ280_06590 [Bacteroidales bacterium]|nr:hypothetical protein [Bacteroidales bacterium]